METNSIVFLSPLFDEDLGFLQGVEDLAVEQLIAELAVETSELLMATPPGSLLP